MTPAVMPTVPVVVPTPVVPSSPTGYTMVNGRCMSPSGLPVPATFCSSGRRSAQPAAANQADQAAAPKSSSALVTALSVCGGLMVAIALVASAVVVVRHIVNKRVEEEIKALEAK